MTGPPPNTPVTVVVAEGARINSPDNNGIEVQTKGAGAITIDNAGAITAGGVGILAGSEQGLIAITNRTSGQITAPIGIAAGSETGAVSVSNFGGITFGKYGIAAGSIAGPVTIENAGTISQSAAISSQIAPELLAALPPEVAGQLTGTAGIFARTGTGALSVNNSGSITAATGIDVGVLGGGTSAGPLSISNTGTITATTGPAINAVGVSAAQISNSGTINGFLSLNTSAPSVFNNLAGGLFATAGTSNFGAGNISNQGQITLANGSVLNNVGQFTNSGTVATNGTTAIGTAQFSNLETGRFFATGTTSFGGGSFSNAGTVELVDASFTSLTQFTNSRGIQVSGANSITTGLFTNAGLINMQNGRAGDQLTINGNFFGAAGSRLSLDFATQTGTTDRLLITGNASGSTAVNVVNLTPGAPFTTSPTLVQVNGTVAPNAFTLGNVQNFGALDVILVPGSGAAPGSFGLSLGTVPSAAGLSGIVALQGAQTLAFQSNSAVLDRVSEIREIQRRATGQAAPLAYAERDPRQAYAASLPNVVKAPPVAAPAPAPAVRLATWGRIYGDLEERDNNIASFTFAGLRFDRDLSYNQRSGGLLAGADAIMRNLTSASDALILGAFGGYTTANVDLKNAAVTQNFSGGSVGTYATYVNGGFFADAIFKADILSLDMSSLLLAQTADVTNLSFLANVGYKFDLSRGFYVEPTAGVEYVRTDFSDSPLLTVNTLPLLDGHATRVRAGARFGTEWVTNNIRIEPSVLPLVYVVVDATGETLTAGGPGTITFASDEGKVRGEIQASVNFFDLGSGWSGFVRGDLRFGEDLIGGSGKAGIRYQW